jgi:hypothetical protein
LQKNRLTQLSFICMLNVYATLLIHPIIQV